MTHEDPILIVDRIDTSSDRASAEIRLGSVHERVELGMSIPGLVAFNHMPKVLEWSPRARNAVIDVVTRAHRGDAVSLPLDLSDVVRASSDPWPTERPGEPVEDESGSVAVTEVVSDSPVTGSMTVHLRVRGVPAVVVVDKRKVQTEATRFRFVSGPHPWQLTSAESGAMLRAILSALSRPVAA